MKTSKFSQCVGLALLTFMIGCGSGEEQTGTVTRVTPKLTNNNDANLPTPSITETPDPVDPEGLNLPAPTVYRVSQIGYREVSFTVQTNKVLKIKYAPLQADKKVSWLPTIPPYSKLGVYIGVNSSQPKATQLLANGLQEPAQESGVMDFSTAFEHSCAASDTSCRQEVTIRISKPNYDHFCMFPELYNNYCGVNNTDHTQVYDVHYWKAQITVQTDDTRVLL